MVFAVSATLSYFDALVILFLLPFISPRYRAGTRCYILIEMDTQSDNKYKATLNQIKIVYMSC